MISKKRAPRGTEALFQSQLLFGHQPRKIRFPFMGNLTQLLKYVTRFTGLSLSQQTF
jgi:hypothetical protein